MTRVRTITLVACLTTSIAGAQEPAPALTLLPAAPSRWDVAAHVTWLGERRANQPFARFRRARAALEHDVAALQQRLHATESLPFERTAQIGHGQPVGATDVDRAQQRDC